MTPTQINHKSDFPLLIRLTDSGGKPDEFAEYNAFAERCKAEARQTLGL